MDHDVFDFVDEFDGDQKAHVEEQEVEDGSEEQKRRNHETKANDPSPSKARKTTALSSPARSISFTGPSSRNPSNTRRVGGGGGGEAGSSSSSSVAAAAPPSAQAPADVKAPAAAQMQAASSAGTPSSMMESSSESNTPIVVLQKKSANDRLGEILGLVEAVSNSDSPTLQRQQAIDLATAFREPYNRSLLYRGTSAAALCSQVFEMIGVAMDTAGNDEEIASFLACAVYFLLKDRMNLQHVKRSVITGIVLLLRYLEYGGEGGGGNSNRPSSKAGGGRSSSRQQQEGSSAGGGGGTAREGPKFGRRKFAAKKSAIGEVLRGLLDEDDPLVAGLGGPSIVTPGQVALCTLHRMLRDDEVENTEDGFDTDNEGYFGRTTPGRGGGSASRRRSLESNSSDLGGGGGGGGYLSDAEGYDQGRGGALQHGQHHCGGGAGGGNAPDDEGAGSPVWRIKEYLRTEGGLPILARLVTIGTKEFAKARGAGEVEAAGGGGAITTKKLPPEATIGQSRLCLDVLESLAFLNVDNQLFLGRYRVPPSSNAKIKAGGAGKRAGSGAAAGGGEVPLVQVLLDLLGHVRAFAEGAAAAAAAALAVAAERDSEEEDNEGGGVLSINVDTDLQNGSSVPIKRRLPDVLLATLRVLVNLTHHNRDAIIHVIQNGGMEVLLDCFLAHTRGSFLDEALQQCGASLKKKATKKGSSSGDSDDKKNGPPHGLRETESFDVKLLALNALTNCAEKSTESRARVAGLVLRPGGIAGIPIVQGINAQVPPSSSSLSSRHSYYFIPLIRFLVQYLLLRIRPFADQFSKDLVAPSDQVGGGNTTTAMEEDQNVNESELFGDKQAEQLVLAGYSALLIGCIMREHAANRSDVLMWFPQRSPNLLIRVLKAFLAFQKQVGVLTSMVMDPIVELISELEGGPLPAPIPSLPFSSSSPSPARHGAAASSPSPAARLRSPTYSEGGGGAASSSPLPAIQSPTTAGRKRPAPFSASSTSSISIPLQINNRPRSPLRKQQRRSDESSPKPKLRPPSSSSTASPAATGLPSFTLVKRQSSVSSEVRMEVETPPTPGSKSNNTTSNQQQQQQQQQQQREGGGGGGAALIPPKIVTSSDTGAATSKKAAASSVAEETGTIATGSSSSTSTTSKKLPTPVVRWSEINGTISKGKTTSGTSSDSKPPPAAAATASSTAPPSSSSSSSGRVTRSSPSHLIGKPPASAVSLSSSSSLTSAAAAGKQTGDSSSSGSSRSSGHDRAADATIANTKAQVSSNDRITPSSSASAVTTTTNTTSKAKNSNAAAAAAQGKVGKDSSVGSKGGRAVGGGGGGRSSSSSSPPSKPIPIRPAGASASQKASIGTSTSTGSSTKSSSSSSSSSRHHPPTAAPAKTASSVMSRGSPKVGEGGGKRAGGGKSSLPAKVALPKKLHNKDVSAFDFEDE